MGAKYQSVEGAKLEVQALATRLTGEALPMALGREGEPGLR